MSRSDARLALSDPELEKIERLVIAYRAARVLVLAARLDVFTLLEGRPKSLAAICRALKLKARPGGIFLNALVALGFLAKRGEGYSNTRRSSRFLVKGKPEYFGPILKFQDILWKAWGDLEHVLKEGSPRKNLGYWLKQEPDFTDEYIRSMRRISHGTAREVAERLHRPGDRELLDVGAGPGNFSLALLERNPRLRAVLLDLPGTLRLTRQFLRTHPAWPRIALEPGDYRAPRLAPERFDLILLSHITHNESPAFSRKLLAACFAALRPGGRVAVHDFMTERDGASPEFSALFAVHMMTFTTSGSVYRQDDYRRWMSEAGFRPMRPMSVAAGSLTPSSLLVGEK